VDSKITVDDIETLFIYPASKITCPDVAGYQFGFMYMAVIVDRDNPNHIVTINDGLCGNGSLYEMSLAAAQDLEETYGIENAFSEAIADKIKFYTQVVPYREGIVSAYRTSTAEPATTPSVTSPATSTPDTDEPDQIPNTTNTVKFEVKAVGSGGNILVDWTESSSIEISSGAQLYFRWDASDYQQCLPFLQDNGDYSLTRKNRAMVSGNTETEQYNVTEKNAVYRIECGGQKNKEVEVDVREVSVIIK
jgi:hypothetical protein